MSSQKKPVHALPVTEMVRNQTGDFVVAVEQLETQRDELLDALEDLLAAVRFWHPDDIGWQLGTKETHQEVGQAEAAIRKVRGGN